MCYFSRKGKKDTQGDSEIIRAATPTTVLGSRASSPLVWQGWATLSNLEGQYLRGRATTESHVCSSPWSWRGRTTLLTHGGDAVTPVSLEGRASDQRGLFLRLEISWNPFALLNLVLAWDTSSPFSFWFFPFGTRVPILCWSHHCNLETHNWPGAVGSQLEKNFCLRMNCTSRLTHIWLRWDFGL